MSFREQLLKKAHTKHMQGKYDAAVKLYREVLRFSSNNLDANYLLGTLYAETGNMAEAGEFLKRADSINPDSPYIKVNLGNVYRTLGDFETAKACYTRALELKGDLPQAYFGLAAILETIDNDHEAAQHYYQQALALSKNSPEPLQVLDKNMARSGSSDQQTPEERAADIDRENHQQRSIE